MHPFPPILPLYLLPILPLVISAFVLVGAVLESSYNYWIKLLFVIGILTSMHLSMRLPINPLLAVEKAPLGLGLGNVFIHYVTFFALSYEVQKDKSGSRRHVLGIYLFFPGPFRFSCCCPSLLSSSSSSTSFLFSYLVFPALFFFS